MFLRKKLDINVELEAYRRLQHANMNHGAILLDVRTPREHKAASLAGSVNLPLNQLKSANKHQKHWRSRRISRRNHQGITCVRVFLETI